VRVVFVFNASESDLTSSDFIPFSIICVRMNEWMSRCVCLEREMCVCMCWLFIYIHSLAKLRDMRVVFVFNTSESDWTPSDPIQFTVVCVSECERENQSMNE
jgi:hypothetical protein